MGKSSLIISTGYGKLRIEFECAYCNHFQNASLDPAEVCHTDNRFFAITECPECFGVIDLTLIGIDE